MNYPWLAELKDQFHKRRRDERMAHACMISGPRGLGKHEFSTAMSATLLCLEQGDSACGSCRSCQLMNSGAHPDFNLVTFEVNPRTDKLRTELVIEQIRGLNAALQLTQSISPRKVALIHPAEAMNRNAANALLKTLEEPAGDSVLLLLSHDPSRLLATIRSRCQSFPVREPDEDVSLTWLVKTMGQELASSRVALKASAGSPLRAYQMLQNEDVSKYQAVMQMLTQVENQDIGIADVLGASASLDQQDLWAWLSLAAADRVRDCYGPDNNFQVATGSQRTRKMLDLQIKADRNRRLLATPLRKDLLLRDWLIQWADRVGS